MYLDIPSGLGRLDALNCTESMRIVIKRRLVHLLCLINVVDECVIFYGKCIRPVIQHCNSSMIFRCMSTLKEITTVIVMHIDQSSWVILSTKWFMEIIQWTMSRDSLLKPSSLLLWFKSWKSLPVELTFEGMLYLTTSNNGWKKLSISDLYIYVLHNLFNIVKQLLLQKCMMTNNYPIPLSPVH